MSGAPEEFKADEREDDLQTLILRNTTKRAELRTEPPPAVVQKMHEIIEAKPSSLMALVPSIQLVFLSIHIQSKPAHAFELWPTSKTGGVDALEHIRSRVLPKLAKALKNGVSNERFISTLLNEVCQHSAKFTCMAYESGIPAQFIKTQFLIQGFIKTMVEANNRHDVDKLKALTQNFLGVIIQTAEIDGPEVASDLVSKMQLALNKPTPKERVGRRRSDKTVAETKAAWLLLTDLLQMMEASWSSEFKPVVALSEGLVCRRNSGSHSSNEGIRTETLQVLMKFTREELSNFIAIKAASVWRLFTQKKPTPLTGYSERGRKLSKALFALLQCDFMDTTSVREVIKNATGAKPARRATDPIHMGKLKVDPTADTPEGEGDARRYTLERPDTPMAMRIKRMLAKAAPPKTPPTATPVMKGVSGAIDGERWFVNPLMLSKPNL